MHAEPASFTICMILLMYILLLNRFCHVLSSESQNSRSHTPYHLHTAGEIYLQGANPHPSECSQLRKRAAGMRRNRLVDNGGESELRYWFKCSHMVSFAAGEGMIKSTGAAHKCRSAGLRFSARIMCCRTFWLDADVGNEPQISPTFALHVLLTFGVSCPGWNILNKTCDD